MAQTTRDLWPSNLVEDVVPRPPVALLREQASLLAEKTQGLIEATVKRDTGLGRFVHRFLLKVPGLGPYEYELFTVSHPIVPVYPARFVFGEDEIVAEDEQEFMEALSKILSSESTKLIVNSLVSQVAS